MSAQKITLILMLSFQLVRGIDIRVMPLEKLQSVEVFPTNGSFLIHADERNLSGFPPNVFFQIQVAEDSLYLICELDTIGKFGRITFEQESRGACKIKATGFDTRAGIYPGNIQFKPYYCYLRIINRLPLEAYLPGVVEAEAGMMMPNEFYKVQAILCRTYALGHLRRHETEGFNLCDKEHCQVYKGVPAGNEDVKKAVESTEGLVVTSEKMELITAAFHSNCGGQTCDPKDVWNSESDGLKSITDSFCLESKNAKWTKEISKEKWLNYLMLKTSVSDTSALLNLFANGEKKRLQFIFGEKKKIPLKEIRSDMNLKSAFFTTRLDGEKITLSGRGFGHGIGLCQEGAISMAKKGYTAFEIIHFYYHHVAILPMDKLLFFMQENE
ncbi:MAG: SpoIID/LytB domain-containing protein [Bacteroidota bacterium]|jgi:stage II sporulation protein D